MKNTGSAEVKKDEETLTHREMAGADTDCCCSYDLFETEPYLIYWFDETKSKEIDALVSCKTDEVIFANNQSTGTTE